MYSTLVCPFCVRAKMLLKRRGIPYEEINLARDPDGRAELEKKTGMVTFPQVVIGPETIGGFDQLLAADRAGRLRDLVAA